MARGPRKLTIKFGATTLTHYGGGYLLYRFLSRIGFKQAIARRIDLAQRNNRSSIGQMLLALLSLGLERIETAQCSGRTACFST